MSQPEADLKRAIVEALHRVGIWCFRNEQGRRGRIAMGCGIGSPDIFVILRPSGRLVGLEAKVGKEKPTANQMAWGQRLEENGGAYFVVRSVAEAVEAVRVSNAETRDSVTGTRSGRAVSVHTGEDGTFRGSNLPRR